MLSQAAPGRSGILARVDEPTGICPHCGGPSEYQNVRYPRALCRVCDSRATDLAQRPVGLGNESISGGFIALHRDDGSPCEQVVADGRVLVDGVEYRAGEAHMGGCVVQPLG
jgi:hypothetical protein